MRKIVPGSRDYVCPSHSPRSSEKAVLTGARERISKKTYIRAAGYNSPTFDAALAKVRAHPDMDRV